MTKRIDFLYDKKYNRRRCKEGFEMAKTGRPTLNITKEKVVSVRMSKEEFQKLQEYSEKHQQTISETIKSGFELLYKTTL